MKIVSLSEKICIKKLSNYLSTKKRHDRQTKLMNNATCRCVDLYNKLLYSTSVPYRELANDIVSVIR